MSARLEQAMALHRAGKLAEAERAYEQVLVSEPANATAHLLLSEIQRDSGRLETAEQSARRAVQHGATNPLAHYNLGEVLRRREKPAEAVDAFRAALKLDPRLPEAHLNLGVALQAAGQVDEAIGAYEAALALRPDYAEAHLNLGVAFQRQRRFDEAIRWYEALLVLRPSDVTAIYSIAVARFEQGDLDGACDSYRCALALDPKHENSRNNLAYTLQVLGRYAEAAALYRRGVANGPNPATAARYLSLASLYDPETDSTARYREQRRFEDRFARPAYARAVSHANSKDPKRRLRVGYLTADFHDHPVARNVEPLLVHRDRARFEVFVYADIAEPDATTERLRPLVDTWRPINGLDDEAVARRIREDGIDMLVILAGHFDRNRPWVAAWRPAPVQISFHDLLSSGLEVMDYFIADRFLHARGNPESFTERVFHLPSFYLHDPLDAPDPGPSPCVGKGYVTFGSFNNPAKVNDAVLDLWARVLQAVPNSHLVLKFRNWYAARSLRARVDAALSKAGVALDRVRLDSAAERRGNHLERYAGIDIALDPFPFSGSTTSFEALWMGVPVVTLAGATLASRWSASMLRALKLDRLIASTQDEYLAIAQELARDRDSLAQLRAGLRGRLAASPLCNGRARARQIERLYRAVWKRWCGQSTEGDPTTRGRKALDAGRLDEAVTLFLQALDRQPSADTLFQLGVALGRQRNFSASADAFRAAITMKPDFAEAYANLGAAWRSLGRFDAAEDSLRTALRLAPDNASAHANLGLLLFDQGRIAEAVAAYTRGIELSPRYLPLWRNRLAAVLYDPQRDEAAHRQLVERFNTRFVQRRVTSFARGEAADPGKRLRIGYVSSDLLEHPIARNLGPVLGHHDRARFEITAYADVAAPDATTARLRGLTDRWRVSIGKSDEELATMIRADGIDILVCLAGRLDKGRPLLAAQRAAPVQVSFHDPGTSGLPGMDYLIADPVLAPRRPAEWFSERVIRLPWFYIHAPIEAPAPAVPPSRQRGHITFGSFNNPAKVNDETLRLWARVVRETPRSVLQLKFRDWFASPGLQARLRSLFLAEGVGPSRLRLGGEADTTASHIARYNDIDIALDPFPFTGSTTTFEALWMGVPVVTLRGKYMAGRWGASMLGAVGLQELIAETPDDYAAIVAQLANYPDRLAQLRAELRGRVAASPLCDARGRARQLERLYRAVWRRWCKAS